MRKSKIVSQNSENYIRSELEILCHVKHKNIIQFYGYFWDEKKIYCIIEYADGGEVFTDMKKYKNSRYPE
jgi:serine/threonine protein kinase